MAPALASEKYNPSPYAEVDGECYPGQDNDERVKPHFFPSEATAPQVSVISIYHDFADLRGRQVK
jgi:hypothetical protein